MHGLQNVQLWPSGAAVDRSAAVGRAMAHRLPWRLSQLRPPRWPRVTGSAPEEQCYWLNNPPLFAPMGMCL